MSITKKKVSSFMRHDMYEKREIGTIIPVIQFMMYPQIPQKWRLVQHLSWSDSPDSLKCVCVWGGKDHSKVVFRWPLKRHIFIHNGRLFAVKLNIPTFISLKTEKKKLNQAKEKKASIKCTLWIDAKKLEQHRTKDNLYKFVLMWSLNIENLCFQQEFWSKNI